LIISLRTDNPNGLQPGEVIYFSDTSQSIIDYTTKDSSGVIRVHELGIGSFTIYNVENPFHLSGTFNVTVSTWDASSKLTLSKGILKWGTE
jgi:hypothetical protein